jgi:hypothetical protein
VKAKLDSKSFWLPPDKTTTWFIWLQIQRHCCDVRRRL